MWAASCARTWIGSSPPSKGTGRQVLAYVSWHRPAAGVDRDAYEQAIEGFHRSLAHRVPSGCRGSTAFRAATLPWLGSSEEQAPEGDGGYEDWYLLDSWTAVGVLEEAAISRGHISAHDVAARLAGIATSSIYRLSEGHPDLAHTCLGVWVARAPGHASPTIGDLLGDGMDRQSAGLWRRCLGLGVAPEYCLLAADPSSVRDLSGVAEARLPAGWTATASRREVLWSG